MEGEEGVGCCEADLGSMWFSAVMQGNFVEQDGYRSANS
jgi:hypothetical protein